MSPKEPGPSFEQLCEAVSLYVWSLPTESEFRRDDWRGRLDETLADIRAELASLLDNKEPA